MKYTFLNNDKKYTYSKRINFLYANCEGKDHTVICETDFLSGFLENYLNNDDNEFLVINDDEYNLLNVKIVDDIFDTNEVKTVSQERIFNILKQAIDSNCSDVHFIRGDDVAYIKLRINGELVLLQELLSTDCDHMLFVLYNVMASTKETTWNIKVPQDANILLDFDGYSYRFRYAHMPLFGKGTDGYHAVIRVIAPNKNKDVCTDLKSLKITQAETKILNNMLSNPSGLIVVSGVTGSGKSTSLKNYMEYLFYTKYEEKGCFITVEDPVEYLISGVQQSSVVRSKEGKNLFADAVRSSLRRDPDVLMIGEIRDIQTGEALSSAVESGHLCLTTVHAGNAVGVLQRLSGLGVSIDKLSTPGFIAGIMNQLLVPKLCEHCSQDRLNDYTRSVKVKGIGCLECNFIGITGRTLVIEQLIPDITVLRLIADKKWVEIYEYLRGVRSKTAFGEGYTIKEKIYSLTLQGTVCSNYFKSSFGRMESENEELIYQVYKYKK